MMRSVIAPQRWVQRWWAVDLTFGHGGQTIRFGPLLDALQKHQAIVLLRWEDLVQRRALRDDTLFWWKFTREDPVVPVKRLRHAFLNLLQEMQPQCGGVWDAQALVHFCDSKGCPKLRSVSQRWSWRKGCGMELDVIAPEDAIGVGNDVGIWWAPGWGTTWCFEGSGPRCRFAFRPFDGRVKSPLARRYSMPAKVPQRCSQLSFPHGTTPPNC